MHFSIIIPTWNNLEYLQLCIKGIRENSAFNHQIIVHVNEGKDGSKKWVDMQKIDYTCSPENIGICKAVNLAFTKAKQDFIVYMNDDMYPLPGWDVALIKAIQQAGEDTFMISATMIEPKASGNDCVIVADFGQSTTTFRKADLLKKYTDFEKNDWNGASWPPVMLSRASWEKVGGFSEAFSPGMYSDPDLSMKLWETGCRIFRGVGESRVYHFQAKSTGKVLRNDGRMQFIHKWGISANAFYKHYLKMGTTFEGKLEHNTNTLAVKLQRAKAWFLKYLKNKK